MCTAITLQTRDCYFGRNLDLEYSYQEEVTITPRHFPLSFRHQEPLRVHYAFIGIAYTPDNTPLYYDATNEKGLSVAGLNFPNEADYKEYDSSKSNIAPFEFIPWILGQCSSVQETISLLQNMNLLEENYSENLPLTPLHWLIADAVSAIVVESVKEGLRIHQNPIGVLTNSPSFDMQLLNLKNTKNLPGDWSSPSRFIKASYVKKNSICEHTEQESISQFFHILASVAHPRGCVEKEHHQYEITVYSSCCNITKGIYYYKTYENSQITAVNMQHADLNTSKLYRYPLRCEHQIYWQN